MTEDGELRPKTILSNLEFGVIWKSKCTQEGRKKNDHEKPPHLPCFHEFLCSLDILE